MDFMDLELCEIAVSRGSVLDPANDWARLSGLHNITQSPEPASEASRPREPNTDPQISISRSILGGFVSVPWTGQLLTTFRTAEIRSGGNPSGSSMSMTMFSIRFGLSAS